MAAPGPTFRWRQDRTKLPQVVEGIKRNPDSRRHIVTAWNPATWGGWRCRMSLLFQVLCRRRRLSCLLYQRSADIFSVSFQHRVLCPADAMMAQVTD